MCIHSSYRDQEDPSLFPCFERWDGRADLDAHAVTAHVKAFPEEFEVVVERWESNHTTVPNDVQGQRDE